MVSSIVCGAALIGMFGRTSDIPPGPWPVHRSQADISAGGGRYHLLVWEPERVSGPRPLILYAPGWGQRAEAGSRQQAYLASHGYVVVAFDDIALDAARSGESRQDTAVRRADFDDATPAAYASSFVVGGLKVQQAARKGRAVLDAVLAWPELAGRIDPERIGFLGFSFGGATGVEQTLHDPRIKAMVNLDGWLFGEASRKIPDRPYLLLYIDDDFPPGSWETSASPRERALAQGCAFDRSIHDKLLERPDFVWLQAGNISHADLSGEQPAWSWKHPFAAAAGDRASLNRRQAGQADVIRMFFDRYLLGQTKAFPVAGKVWPGDMMRITMDTR